MARAKEKRPGPPGGVRDENRRRRSEELRTAALTLFLARGIESVTIDEIVEQAGVAKGSFYRYFDDKAALVSAMFEPLGKSVSDAFDVCERELEKADSEHSLLEAYRTLAGLLAAAIIGSPQLAQLYLQEARSPAAGARAPVRALADHLTTRSVELTGVAHRRGLLRPFDARISARAVVGAVEALLFALLAGAELGEPLSIPDQVISLVLDGLRPAARTPGRGK
jgi:AcrR family transcriptional regulator